MKRLLASAAIALSSALSLFYGTEASAAPPAAVPARPKIVDVDDLPYQINLWVGQSVFFMRELSAGADQQVGSTSKQLEQVTEKHWPSLLSGYILEGFRATEAGTAEVTIKTTVVRPNAVPHFTKVRVVIRPHTTKPVTKLPPAPGPQKAPFLVDLSKPLPANITLSVGQTVIFQNGSGTITAKETDSKGKLLEKRPHNTFNQVAAFQAKRAGTGEITVKEATQGLLNVIATRTIKMTVK